MSSLLAEDPALTKAQGRRVAADAPAIASSLADLIEPLIRAEVARRVEASASAERSNDDLVMMAACRRLGEALDRLEAVKFTAGEPGARRALENAARHLRGLMTKRGMR